MTSVEDLASDVGLSLNTDDYEYFIDDVLDLLNDKSNPHIDKDRIASLCERSKLQIAKDVLYKCYHRPHRRERGYQRRFARERTKPKWWQTYYNDKVRKRSTPHEQRSPPCELSPRELPKGRQIQEEKRRRRDGQADRDTPVHHEMNLEFSAPRSDVPEWPGRPQSPRRRRRSPSPTSHQYRRKNKKRRR